MDIRPVEASKRNLGSGGPFSTLGRGCHLPRGDLGRGAFSRPWDFGARSGPSCSGTRSGNTLMALGGVPGSDHGIPSMVSVRPSFGIRGSSFAAILNVLQLVCWASIMLTHRRPRGAMLGEPIGGIWASNRFWIVVIGSGTLAWALFTGHRVWKILQAGAVVRSSRRHYYVELQDLSFFHGIHGRARRRRRTAARCLSCLS